MRNPLLICVCLLSFLMFPAGMAEAVTLNPRGLGQVLIFPYYTVNAGQDTLISVTNTGNRGKAVRLRFLEGYNNQDVIDFDLFLSPKDVWTGAITADAAGGARLISQDHSCTLPALPAAGIAFSAPAAGNDNGWPSGMERTREGSIQMFALGDIVPGSATDTRTAHENHGQPNDGTPPGCGEITTANVAADLGTPGDELFGAGAIVDVGAGTYYPYNADALAGFTSRVLYAPTVMEGPYLGSANSAEATHGVARAYVFTGRKALALDYARGEDAVSAVFMAKTLRNEFFNASALGAATDWLVTFPTKQYYEDNPTAPFDFPFAGPGRLDVTVQADFFDHEEGAQATHAPPDGCGFLCPPSPPLALPYAVNVVRILPLHTAAQPSEVFASKLSTALLPFAFTPGTDLPPLGAGWVDLDLDGDTRVLAGGQLEADGRAVALHGLPATGFMAYKVINANAQPGRLANYNGVFVHRSTFACSTEATSSVCP